MATSSTVPSDFDRWLTALEARHLADLRMPEVTRALRALSSAYVERRHRLARGATLDGAGKRAAFALYYGPLHYLIVERVVAALGAAPPATIIDLGCGTGGAGAAWARSAATRSTVLGLDRHPWAVDEARWTYRFFGLDGSARISDVTKPPVRLNAATGVVAAYVLNELADSARERLESWLLTAAGDGATILIVEPIARGIAPWWDATAARFTHGGGRVDEWRFAADLPEAVVRFARAAGLSSSHLTCRTLAVNLQRPRHAASPG